MNCEQCRELLLAAGVDELRRDDAGALGDHLRDCERCRSRAHAILAEYERLAHALGAVERAHVVRARRRWTMARRAAAVLLPAAAAVGGLFVLRSAEEPDPIDPAALYAALHPPRPIVEPAAGLRAAVVTTDQNVTLVLLYQGD